MCSLSCFHPFLIPHILWNFEYSIFHANYVFFHIHTRCLELLWCIFLKICVLCRGYMQNNINKWNNSSFSHALRHFVKRVTSTDMVMPLSSFWRGYFVSPLLSDYMLNCCFMHTYSSLYEDEYFKGQLKSVISGFFWSKDNEHGYILRSNKRHFAWRKSILCIAGQGHKQEGIAQSRQANKDP